ncbi:Hypothetical protein I595_2182 [Croceitalea dokdonensis DOKDO 023]|uniref:Uncharacterized protein n=1 Tax=Croceitalea dokdonensis DOKDO 023 TaxID=1300341 RepID=A0A0P7AV06_9FLAO|nr:tetratricopeptide repeat protein [Croceitalea dokdonensis]KPM31687.1 Hypothetical protein I595_2182 [Croceitalea dokdonensis DOKDO 023]
MATYKKRGYKPKNKAEEIELDEQNSTTAEVFSSLDEGASKTEQWFTKNQNYILGLIGLVAIGVLGYLAYNQYVQKPKEASAANELYYPQQYFEQAMAEGAAKDSLLNLALSGAEGKFGFLDIIEEYPATKAANLATYSAGMSFLNLQNYKEAIEYLEDFNSDDAVLGALAKGGIGDAFSQLDQKEDALDYYEKAIAHDTNGFTTPRFLYKAGIIAMELGYADRAATYFERIQDEFKDSKEANNIEALLGMVK